MDSAEEKSPDSDEFAALRQVLDPELGVNIVDLGLVYGVARSDDHVHVRVTMTSPACPLTEMLEDDITAALRALPGISAVEIEWVWEPAWDPSMMSIAARAVLGE